MPSSYSPNLRIELIASGEQANTWGYTTNTNLGTLIEQAICGQVALNLTTTAVTLTALNGASDQSRQMILNCFGSPGGTTTLTAPSVSKVYIVANNVSDGSAVQIKTSTGAAVVIAAGTTKTVWCDGVDFHEATNAFAAAAIATSLTVGTDLAVGGTSTSLTGAKARNYDAAGFCQRLIPSSTGTSATIQWTDYAETTPWTSLVGSNALLECTTAFKAASLSVGSNSVDAFPSGTRLVFAQATAPTGWTQDTSDTANNRMIRVVNTTGGGVGGSYDPTLMNVVPYHTHGYSGYVDGNTTGTYIADPGHAHGVYDPGHAHNYTMANNVHAWSYGSALGKDSNNTTFTTAGAATGIGIYGATTGTYIVDPGHVHTYSGYTDGGSSQTNWTPRYNDTIICQKN